MASGKSWNWTFESLGDSIGVVNELIELLENTVKRSADGCRPVDSEVADAIARTRALKSKLIEARTAYYAHNAQGVSAKTEDIVVAPFGTTARHSI